MRTTAGSSSIVGAGFLRSGQRVRAPRMVHRVDEGAATGHTHSLWCRRRACVSSEVFDPRSALIPAVTSVPQNGARGSPGECHRISTDEPSHVCLMSDPPWSAGAGRLGARPPASYPTFGPMFRSTTLDQLLRPCSTQRLSAPSTSRDLDQPKCSSSRARWHSVNACVPSRMRHQPGGRRTRAGGALCTTCSRARHDKSITLRPRIKYLNHRKAICDPSSASSPAENKPRVVSRGTKGNAVGGLGARNSCRRAGVRRGERIAYCHDVGIDGYGTARDVVATC